MGPGRDGGGDLTITGDTLVTGTGAMVGGTDSATGFASAQFRAGHNVSVAGAITVTAVAFMDVVGSQEASATANLIITGGDFGGASGNVSIAGDMTVTADARHLGGTSSAFAFAFADINADDDIAITGNLSVAATAIAGRIADPRDFLADATP